MSKRLTPQLHSSVGEVFLWHVNAKPSPRASPKGRGRKAAALVVSHAALILVVLLLNVPRACGQNAASQIDVEKLVRLAQQNGETMSKRVFDYSWKSKSVVRNYKKARLINETEQDHEVYPAPGLTYVAQKLIKENGLPLSPKRAAKEQKRLNRELTDAEVQQTIFHNGTPTAENKTGCPTFGIWTVLNGTGGAETSLGISDFLCFSNFFASRTERRDGRDAVVLLFRPRENLVIPVKEKTPFAKLIGAIWIDVQDKVVSHIEAWSADNPRAFTTTLPTGPASIVFDDMRLPDGMWVRRYRYVDTRKNPLAFNRLNLEWKQEFSGYQRYTTESKDYTIAVPKQRENKIPPNR